MDTVEQPTEVVKPDQPASQQSKARTIRFMGEITEEKANAVRMLGEIIQVRRAKGQYRLLMNSGKPMTYVHLENFIRKHTGGHITAYDLDLFGAKLKGQYPFEISTGLRGGSQKHYDPQRIVEALKEHGPMTERQIVAVTKLNQTIVNRCLRELEAKGLVKVVGMVKTKVRPAKLWAAKDGEEGANDSKRR